MHDLGVRSPGSEKSPTGFGKGPLSINAWESACACEIKIDFGRAVYTHTHTTDDRDDSERWTWNYLLFNLHGVLLY